MYLLVSILGSSLGFVETGEATVVSLIQPPSLLSRQIGLSDFGKNGAQSLLSTGEERSVGNVKLVSSILQGLAGSGSLFLACKFFLKLNYCYINI